MTTQLENPSLVRTSTSPAQRLRTTMAAARLSFTWLGVRKSLTTSQKATAAESFNAAGAFLSAGKKLIDTRHPAFRAVSAIRHQAGSLWKGMTLPYPVSGIRLIRQDQLVGFDAAMLELRSELTDAVARLDEQRADLQAAARDRLGLLYDPADYPPSFIGLFAIEWDFPTIEPPDYLRRLNPALYEQERERIARRFDEAVQLAEQAFTSELAKLVGHLTERLTGADDGKPKVFRDSAVANLAAFFERFRSLNVRSNEELDALVDHCQQIVHGIAPQALRDQSTLREAIAEQLAGVQTALDALLVDQPRRRLLRRPVSAAEAS